VLGIPACLNQCRVIMHTQALQQKTRHESGSLSVCSDWGHVVALPGPCCTTVVSHMRHAVQPHRLATVGIALSCDGAYRKGSV
jgi:hypothetical protein